MKVAYLNFCGISSKNTALRLMEEADLIRLDTKRGRSPVVQIIDAELRPIK